MKSLSLIFTLIFLSAAAFAEDAVQKLRQNLKSLDSAVNCAPGSQFETCDFQKTCQKLSEKSGDVILYKDADGRALPNYPWFTNRTAKDFCGSSLPQFELANRLLNPIRQVAKEERKQFDQRVSEDKKIFQEVQSDVVAYLESAPLTADQKTSMINRINSVEFKVIEPGIEGAMESECHAPNAFYHGERHRIVLCPQFINLPKDTLRFVLMHELGHSIDPCALNSQLIINDQGEMQSILPDPYLDKMVPKTIYAKAIPGSRNPFTKALQCLESKSPKEFGTPSLAQISKTFDERLQRLIETEGEDSQVVERVRSQIEDLKENYPDLKYCAGAQEAVRPLEAFSDWLATEVTAMKIKSGASINPQLAFGSFYATSCESLFKDVHRQVISSSKNQKCESADQELLSLVELAQKKASGQTTHASSASRLEKIYLGNPDVAKAVGCEPRPQCKAF